MTQGVAAERAVLEAVKDRADVVIDSTGLKAHMLRRKIADEFLPRRAATRLAVTLESFGFKHGPAARRRPRPRRPLPAQPALRADAASADRPRRRASSRTSSATAASRSSTSASSRCSTSCFPQYVAEGKAHLTIAIGCTGGRHRSVAIAEHLGRRSRERDDVLVEVVHRDADRPRGRRARPHRPRGRGPLAPARFYDALMHRSAAGARRLAHAAIGYGRDRPRILDHGRRRGAGARRGHVAIAAAGRRGRRRPPAGIAAGGRDGGAPAPRASGPPNYYSGYLVDPDGAWLELVSGSQ